MSPKISIITVCFNSENTIENTLQSVANQKNISDVEHIVIDGASSDSTISILEKYENQIKLVSEPDKGIYDAMNKGIALASGEILGTLNADDFYYTDDVLSQIESVFSDPSIKACYGDLLYVKQENTDAVVRFWQSNDYKQGMFETGWVPAHPTFFVRKDVYENFGSFDLDYKIAADFELLFRFVEKHNIKTKYIPKILVKMRLGGTTNKSLSNVIKQNQEIIKVLRAHYANFSVLRFLFNKLANRTLQFLKYRNIK